MLFYYNIQKRKEDGKRVNQFTVLQPNLIRDFTSGTERKFCAASGNGHYQGFGRMK